MRNALNYLTKGHGRAIRLDRVRGVDLITEAESSRPFIDIKDAGDDMESNITLWKHSNTTLDENRIKGWIRLTGFKDFKNLADFHIHFNHYLIGEWDYATRGNYLPFQDFKFMYRGSSRLQEWGRTTNLIYDLSERRCSLEFPAIMEVNSPGNIYGKPTICSPIPAYEDLIEELKDRGWM